MSPADGMMVDHIDRNTLNCRRSNMRTVTVTKNNHNRRIWGDRGLPEGVQERNGRFRAKIGAAGRFMHLGTFDTPEEAGAAYAAAREARHE
jgi:hypothetical protein